VNGNSVINGKKRPLPQRKSVGGSTIDGVAADKVAVAVDDAAQGVVRPVVLPGYCLPIGVSAPATSMEFPLMLLSA